MDLLPLIPYMSVRILVNANVCPTLKVSLVTIARIITTAIQAVFHVNAIQRVPLARIAPMMKVSVPVRRMSLEISVTNVLKVTPTSQLVMHVMLASL